MCTQQTAPHIYIYHIPIKCIMHATIQHIVTQFDVYKFEHNTESIYKHTKGRSGRMKLLSDT